MPLYEYQCTACHKLTEKRQKFSDPELTECPHCGGRLERTITAPAVQFKGGGWYADLYSSGKKPAAGNSAATEGSNSTSGDGTKSDGASKAAPNAAPASSPASSTANASTSAPSTSK